MPKVQHTIPIVFATIDDELIYCMYVTMVSMLKNKLKTTNYEFYILVPDNFSDTSKQKIGTLERQYNDCKVIFINMKDAFINAPKMHERIIYATYYRLLIAEALPQISKCIYLDIDILVRHDLWNLYSTDMEGYYLAGAKAGWYTFPENAWYGKDLGIPSLKGYIQAGVVLMNLDAIRKDNITSEFLQLTDKKFKSQDQDILNVACYGHIKHLPLKNNFTINCSKYSDEELRKTFSQDEINEARKDPTIFHFADKIKPWHDKSILYGNEWWKYAKMTPFYKELKKMIIQNRDKTILAKPNKVSKLLLFSFIPLLKVEYYDQKTTYLLFNFIPILEKKVHKNKIYYKLFAVLPFLKCKIKGEL